MKKIGKVFIMIFVCSLCIFGTRSVNAKEDTYFENKNGISLTKEEYNFLTEMYWEGFQDNMTQKEYDFFKDGNYFNKEVESNIVYDGIYGPITRGSEYNTPAKSLKIAKSCGNNCAITISAKWLGNPTVRSYDVIGAYLYNVSKIGTLDTVASASLGTNYAAATKTQANGFGSSVLLPNGINVYVYQTFVTTQGGRIYASYQHAKRNTTLAVSQQFDISVVGYGGVLKFYGDAANIYDAMNGVQIDV